LLTAVLLLLPAVVAAQERVEVQPGGTVTWDEMLAAEARAPRGAVPRRAIPRLPGPPPREFGGAPLVAPPAAAPSSAELPATVPAPAGPTVLSSFAALEDDNTAIPPDTMGAVGPLHLMTMLNTQVRIQTKVGVTISTVSLAAFWTSGTGLTGDPFDPKVVYDSIHGRWIATVDADGNSATSQVWFAISATSDPTGAWTFYGFDADTGESLRWADFPGFGVNSTWIAITNNMFTVGATPSFLGAKMWVLEKADALVAGPLTVTVFPTAFDVADGFDGFALKPAVTYSAAEPALYIVDQSGWEGGGIPVVRLSRITGTGPAPTWAVVPGGVGPGSGAGFVFVTNDFRQDVLIGAPQMGTATLIDAGDPRASDSVYRNGRLWFAHTGGLPNAAPTRNAVFWYQMNPATMSIPNSGVLDGGGSVHHYYPSIAANTGNDALVGFSRSSPSLFVEAVYASRFAADPVGVMSTGPTVIKLGEDSYVKTFSGPDVRWGDYSATCVDPLDDTTFWTIQEYAETDVGGSPSDDRWGTWWAMTGPVPPTSTTTTSTTTSTTTTTLMAAVGHLKCYKTKDARPKASYTLDLMAGVAGFTNETGCTLKLGAKKICVEVNKQNVNPAPPGGGPAIPPNTGSVFLSYKIKCPKQTLGPVGFADQFGTDAFTPKTAAELLVPALPGPANDHFKCYKTKDVRPKATYTMDLMAGVAGFTNETGCTVKLGAKQICVQVTKQNVNPPPPGGGPLPGPSSGARFVSYKLKCPKQTLGPGNFTDQFGAGTFTPRSASGLLVPAGP
jgi:hypothetical protein